MEDFYETRISEVDGQMIAFFGVFDGTALDFISFPHKMMFLEFLLPGENFTADGALSTRVVIFLSSRFFLWLGTLVFQLSVLILPGYCHPIQAMGV